MLASIKWNRYEQTIEWISSEDVSGGWKMRRWLVHMDLGISTHLFVATRVNVGWIINKRKSHEEWKLRICVTQNSRKTPHLPIPYLGVTLFFSLLHNDGRSKRALLGSNGSWDLSQSSWNQQSRLADLRSTRKAATLGVVRAGPLAAMAFYEFRWSCITSRVHHF